MRPLVNYAIWAVLGFFAALAIVDAPNMYVMLGNVAGVCGFLYAIRTFLVIVFMVIGLMGDDPLDYTNFGDDTHTDDRSLYRLLYGWGADIRLYVTGANSNTNSGYENADEYYYMIDMQLEAFNIIAGAAAYSFFDIGLKIWEPLAKMGISYIPKDMKYFRKALYLKKLKIYTKKFDTEGEEGRSSEDVEEEGDSDEAF